MGKKIVIDTNVFISAFGWGGVPEEVLTSSIQEKTEILISPEQLAELEQVFTRLRIPEHMEKMTLIRSMTTLITIPRMLHIILEDPSDDIILETAVVGGAACIVSGDHHLLQLRCYRDIIICTPREFLK